jgi:hypothetical protein
MKKIVVVILLLSVALWSAGCKKGESAGGAPVGASASSAPPAGGTEAPAAETAKTGMTKVKDMSEAWSALYAQNEKAINDYEGMPIMGLVTPPLTFATGVQFDLLNTNDADGRFDGQLLLAGYKGFEEKKGSNVTFGYDQKLEKDGFGPTAKAGDRVAGNGSFDLAKEHYILEEYTERAGKKIVRSHCEFKRLPDGSILCLSLFGSSINAKGDEELSDEVIYLHNGIGRYDFVIGKAKTGPEFKALSFVDKGDLTKEQALELVKTSGYTIETSGGIKDGKLVLDK